MDSQKLFNIYLMPQKFFLYFQLSVSLFVFVQPNVYIAWPIVTKLGQNIIYNLTWIWFNFGNILVKRLMSLNRWKSLFVLFIIDSLLGPYCWQWSLTFYITLALTFKNLVRVEFQSDQKNSFWVINIFNGITLGIRYTIQAVHTQCCQVKKRGFNQKLFKIHQIS